MASLGFVVRPLLSGMWDTRQQDVGRYGLMIRNIVSDVRCPSAWPPDDLPDRDQTANVCSQVTDVDLPGFLPAEEEKTRQTFRGH